MNRHLKPVIVCLTAAYLTLVTSLGQPTLQPLEHFKGNRLQQLRQQMLQGAEASANSGAGYDAVRILSALATSDATDDPGRRAKTLLRNWGLEDAALDPSREEAINAHVRDYLKQDHQARENISEAAVLLEFEDYTAAASTLSATRPEKLKGESKSRIEQFWRRNGVDSEGGNTWSSLSRTEQESRLQAGRELVQRIEAADFLVKADPTAGAMYWALVQRLYPNAKAVKEARQQQTEDPRSRFGFGFGRRTLPPNLAQRFGSRFGGGGREEPEDSQEQDVEPTIEGLISSLDFLAKDDTKLAMELLQMGLQYFADAPDRRRLEEVVKQAEAYVASLNEEETDRSAVLVTRFDGKRKAGKAGKIFSGELIPTYELTLSEDQLEALKKNPKNTPKPT